MFKLKNLLSIAVLVTASAVLALEVPKNKIVDTSWVENNLMDDSMVLIDLRGDKELYKKDHIPNAIQWSVSDFREARSGLPGYIGAPLSFERLAQKSGVTDDSAIIFYTEGTSATDYTAATLALHIAEYYGLTNTAILNGGYAAWVKDGKDTNKDKAKPKKSDFKITTIEPKDIATIYDMDDAVVTGDWIIMDGRNKAQFSGEAAHPKAAKAGHANGANHLFIADFTENKDGVFYLYTDKSKVSSLIDNAGGDAYKPTLWYCNTGWFATGGWFMSKYILQNPKVKVYDGSMNEYSSYPKREVIKGE